MIGNKSPPPAKKSSAKNGRIDTEPCGKVVRVRCKDVKRFETQPRSSFEQKKLEGLAAAIREEGQLTPIEITADGTLVDGERRLIAIRDILRRPSVLAIVNEEKLDEIKRLVRSFGANNNREAHTPLEIAHTIRRMLDGNYTSKRVAAISGRSVGWVGQYLGLLKLHEDVQKRMEPAIEGGYYLRFYICVRLCAIGEPKQQLRVADYICRHELPTEDAIAYIASQAKQLGFKDEGVIQGRRPSDEFDILNRFHRQVNRKLGVFEHVDMPTVFRNRSCGEQADTMRELDRAMKRLQQLRDRIANAKTSKQ